MHIRKLNRTRICLWFLAGALLGQPPESGPAKEKQNKSETKTPPAKPVPPNVPGAPWISIYNKRMDALGQKTEALAAEVMNGSTFDTQLDNLRELSKPAIERIFTSGRRAALGRVQGMTTWWQIFDGIAAAKKHLLLDGGQTTEWKDAVVKLKADIAAASKGVTAAENNFEKVAGVFEEVGKAKEVLQFATMLSETRIANVSKADLRIAGRLQEAIATIGANLSSIQSPAGSASDVVRTMKVDLWKAEIDHLRALIRIEERRVAGERDLLGIFQGLEPALKCDSTTVGPRPCTLNLPAGPETVPAAEEIDATLRRFQRQATFASREQLRVATAGQNGLTAQEQVALTKPEADRTAEERELLDKLARTKAAADKAEDRRSETEKQLLADAATKPKKLADAERESTDKETRHRRQLHSLMLFLENWAALAARAETPGRLAQLRAALEERRFAIRRDAILARGYEQIIAQGASRIATYYKGGIRPEVLAQFLQAASTAGIIPAIAIK